MEDENKSKVSVIIPTYNRANLVGRAIRSTLNQTYPHFEIIVVDDGSTDNTEGIVKSFGDHRIKYYKFEENRGVHEARNTGIEVASGSYIVFLDSDDELLPHALGKIVETFVKLPEEVGIVFASSIVHPGGELTGFNVENSTYIEFTDILCRRKLRRIKKCLGAVKRECLGDTRWVTQGFDFIFWRKLEKNWKTFFIDEPLEIYHKEEDEMHLTKLKRRADYIFKMADISSDAYNMFLDEFGSQLKKYCPCEYAEYAFYCAYHSLCAGKYRRAIKYERESLKESLKHACFRPSPYLQLLKLLPSLLRARIFNKL